jgi:peptide/nickel transport system substrate-binding protein
MAMNSVVRIARLAITAGAVTLLAVSCSSASDNEGAQDQSFEPVSITVPADGPPQPGGRVVYGLEADSDGFNPVANRWAIAGYMVANAVYDPLAVVAADGSAAPYLAEAFEHNDDFTEWTIRLRPGVTFHNGAALDADAVVANLEGHRTSALTSTTMAPVSAVTADGDLAVKVTMSEPWVAFPYVLVAQPGYVAEPTMLAGGAETGRSPVGTGPFSQNEWVPGTRWVGDKFADYWQAGLPYLDSVEFRPIPEVRQRLNSLNAGEITMMHTTNPGTILELRQSAEAGRLQVVEDPGEAEEAFVLLNLDEAPLNDLRVRQALAFATDTGTFNQVINSGLNNLARGFLGPDSPFYTDTDYPGFDPDRAAQLVQEYIDDPSTPSTVSFTLTTTTSPEIQEAGQLLAEQWGQVGIRVELSTLEQAQFINTAITGNFQANLWRQYGAVDPDANYVWWVSENKGQPNVLNFPNMFDDQIDDALRRGRQNPDPEVRRQAYADLQNRMAELLPFIWLTETRWAVAATREVRGIINGPLPDGGDTNPFAGGGVGAHRLTHTWLER